MYIYVGGNINGYKQTKINLLNAIQIFSYLSLPTKTSYVSVTIMHYNKFLFFFKMNTNTQKQNNTISM